MTRHARAIPLLHDFLAQAAERVPWKVALVSDGERFGYGELEARSNALAHALVRRGVKRGDRVIVFGDNTVETWLAFWAVLKANAVVSLISPQTKSEKLAYLLADCRPAALISHDHLANVFAGPARASPHLKAIVVSGGAAERVASELPRACAWSDALSNEERGHPPPRRSIDVDLASIIYTSGSTGEPKGVMHTHQSMRAASTSITTYLENDSDDVILNVLPLSFDYGMYQMIMATQMQARLVLERSFAYPAKVLAAVVEEGVTGFPGVPTIFAMLGAMRSLDQYDFSRVRYVTNTAAALSVKHIDRLKGVFPRARVYSMYGLTECKRVSYLPPEDLDRKPTSVGVPIPNTEIWAVDEDDRRVPPGQVGQLVVRGATVMRGYWEKPEATRKKLREGPVPGERVLYTGDYVRIDEEGYLFFVGRMDDIIKSRGEKVAPKEVESALVNIPGVLEAAVIGVPDDILGQAVAAFVVLEPDSTLTARDIQRQCQARLEAFMAPKYVTILAELPKTTTGKIVKTGLRLPAAPLETSAEQPGAIP